MSIKLKNTEAYMYGFSKRLIRLLKIEIGRNRTRNYRGKTVNAPIDNTGSLKNSLELAFTKSKLNKSISGGSFNLTIKGNSYGEKIDEGGLVKAKVSDIIKWIKRKPVKLTDARGRFVKVDDFKINRLANNIVRKLNGNTGDGIKATNFIGDAIEIAMQQINSIEEPVEKDIYLNIDEIFKRAGYEERGGEYRLKRQRIIRRTGETFKVKI